MIPNYVSPAKRIAQIGASVIFCFCIAGLVFGFAALKPILLSSGVYSHLCEGEGTCKAQDTRLNLLFIVATSSNNVAALPLGTLLDRVGPKISSIAGACVFAIGCFVFGLGYVGPYFDTYLAGYFLMALGAPAMFLAQFHLSNAFPARSGLILGAITGAFDASSMPFVFYKLAFYALGEKPTIRVFFWFYTIIPILMVLQQFTFGPTELYSRPSDHKHVAAAATGDDDEGLERALSPTPSQMAGRRMSSAFSRISYDIPDEADEEEVKQALEGDSQDGIVGAMFGRSVVDQIKSPWFWAMEFLIIVHMTRINWYLATVNTQLVYYTGDVDLANTLTDAFIFLLPIGGLVGIPAVGWLLDTRPTFDVTLVMFVLGFFFGVGTLFSSTVAQLLGIGMLVVFRPLFYTAVSDYAAKVFGFETFGTVYGLAMTMSGLFGLVLNPLDLLVKGPLNGDYTPINVTLLVFGVISSLTLAYKVHSYSAGGEIALPVIMEEDEPES